MFISLYIHMHDVACTHVHMPALFQQRSLCCTRTPPSQIQKSMPSCFLVFYAQPHRYSLPNTSVSLLRSASIHITVGGHIRTVTVDIDKPAVECQSHGNKNLAGFMPACRQDTHQSSGSQGLYLIIKAGLCNPPLF